MPYMTNDHVVNSKDNLYNMIRILCRQKSGLNICYINAQSLNNKIDEYRLLFENSGVDIICVSETWFDPAVFSSIFDLSDFNLFRCDRKTHAGGVAIYVRNGIVCKKCYNSEPYEQIEYIFVEVSSVSEKVLIGCVYRPNRLIKTDAFLAAVGNITLKYEEIVICGDFNSNILCESHLVDDMKAIGLFAINTSTPTHYTATTDTLIDIIFVSNKDRVSLYDQLSAPCFSKHDLLFLSLDFQFQPFLDVVKLYDYKNIDYNILQYEMLRIDWNSIYFMPNVENQLDFLEYNLNNIFETCVPIKTFTNRNKRKPWFNNDIRLSIRKRDILFNRWKRFKTEEMHKEYCIARKYVNKKIKVAKTTYYSSLFRSAVGSKQTWKIIKNIGIHKSSSMQADDIDIDALNEKFTALPSLPMEKNSYQYQPMSSSPNLFNLECVNQQDIFLSCLATKSNAVGTDRIQPKFVKLLLPFLLPYITHIFNTIITKSVFPKNWKLARIIPIPKANSDYRPIAILPFLSKVFEKLIHRQIYKYVNDNGLLTERQSGFRPRHSCTTALLEVSEDIRSYIDKGDITLLVLLDHSKAFDMVNHETLCIKLGRMFHFSQTTTRLLSSYLKDRYQSVFLRNHYSRPLHISRGVPQGSILGPLLFAIYINDLVDKLIFCKTHLYADDLQIYVNTNKDNIDDCINNLNRDLERVHIWAEANSLCINPSKSKCLVITPRSLKVTTQLEIVLNNQQIEIVGSTKNLGIIFNSNLTWSDHINYVSGRAFGMLRSLWKTQYFTPLKVRVLLAKSYLIPILLYGCEIFASCESAG